MSLTNDRSVPCVINGKYKARFHYAHNGTALVELSQDVNDNDIAPIPKLSGMLVEVPIGMVRMLRGNSNEHRK
jgi:hypothetical protein